jgi:replicative DNA helicase
LSGFLTAQTMGLAVCQLDLSNLTNAWWIAEFRFDYYCCPSVNGKTAFALSMVRNIVVGEKLPVAFFSLEMTAIQLVLRLISAEAQINQQKLRTGRISSEENAKIISALGKLADAPLFYRRYRRVAYYGASG